jgi:hypothetical protein
MRARPPGSDTRLRPTLASSEPPGSSKRASTDAQHYGDIGVLAATAGARLLAKIAIACSRRSCGHSGSEAATGSTAPAAWFGRFRTTWATREAPGRTVLQSRTARTVATVLARPRCFCLRTTGATLVPSSRRTRAGMTRQNPNVGAQTLRGRRLFAARFPLQHDAAKCACNRKYVTRPFPHQTETQEKVALCRSFDSGGGIRTRDLRVMSGFGVFYYMLICRAFMILSEAGSG